MLRRHPANPILSAQAVTRYPATLVFNAGVCKHQGRYVMVFRNDVGRWGDRKIDETCLGIASSEDGVDWQVAPEPWVSLERARALAEAYQPGLGSQVQRFYDPRLTVCEGRVYLCFAVDTDHGIRAGLAVTDDWGDLEILSLLLPDNRNHVLFPQRIDGMYVRLERPMLGSYLRQKSDVWLSRSSDLKHWGDARLVLDTESVAFANEKIGPGAPPIRTDRGWLTTFHAVETDPSHGKRGWEPAWQKTYRAGLMLLDLADPTHVLGMMAQPLLNPQLPYEREGFRHDVIFPGGMILEEDGEVKLYYGAADTVECLAVGHVDQLVDTCLD